MDAIYQCGSSTPSIPVEALIIAILLAFVPYFLLRWIVERDRALVVARNASARITGMTGGQSHGESDRRPDLGRAVVRRTGMSFQRTRMSADRTLMSVIRTSLSLISFGFTIFQVFQKLQGGRHDRACRGAAQFRHRAGRARHRDARRRHHLPRAVHAGPAQGAQGDDGGRARSMAKARSRFR